MKTIVLGAGPVGLTTAMLLARDGHQVTVLDRDAAGPVRDAEQAWDQWHRPGVNQFRHPHIMLPGAYHLLARELPEAVAELKALGAVPHNMIAGAWDLAAMGGRQPGDERFETLAVRRPVIEVGLGAAAAHIPGITIHRGVVVDGLLSGAEPIPHVTGVLTKDGRTFQGDLIIDALGRNSPVRKMFIDLGAVEPIEERQETGFLAYTRYFRSTDGTMPAQAAWPLDHYDSLSATTVPGDAGTWALLLFPSGRDRAMRALSDPEVWQRVAALYPNVAHWATHGEPITGVLAMSGMEARYRRFVVDGRPVATGLLSIGDAWATTNPEFGMGITMGLYHAALLRDLLREIGIGEREKLALRFDEVTNTTLGPIYQAGATWDRHRLAQIDGEIAGVPYETDDPDWQLRNALDAAKLRDPEVMRATACVGSLLTSTAEAFAAPGLIDTIVQLGSGAARYPEPGPTRAQLLTAIGGA